MTDEFMSRGLEALREAGFPIAIPAGDTNRTRYESHAWSGGDDDECVACGVTWQDCEDECPGVLR